MKNLLAGLLAPVSLVTLVACSSSQAEPTTPAATATDATQQTTAPATTATTQQAASGGALDPKVLEAIRGLKAQPTNTCERGTHPCTSNDQYVCVPDSIAGCPAIPTTR